MDKEKSTPDLLRVVANIAKTIGAVSGLVLSTMFMREFMKFGTELEILADLYNELGKDFIEACKQDEECRRKLDDMVSTIVEYKLSEPSEKEWEKKKMVEELRKKLEELGIEISYDFEEYEGYTKCWIRIDDVEFYAKDCEVWYMGRRFGIDEVVR